MLYTHEIYKSFEISKNRIYTYTFQIYMWIKYNHAVIITKITPEVIVYTPQSMWMLFQSKPSLLEQNAFVTGVVEGEITLPKR